MRGGGTQQQPQQVVTMKRLGGSDGRMPSLFTAEEAEYNRFAACLAATEGLRRMRDNSLLEHRARVSAGVTTTTTTTGSSSGGSGSSSFATGATDKINTMERKINDHYQANSGKVLRAMGMTIDRFNELGREISKNDKLKDRIMEQAYLYRMAAMVNLDQIPLASNDENDGLGGVVIGGGGGGGGGVGRADATDGTAGTVSGGFQRDKIRLFCQSIRDIEQLRADQVERLKKSLRVDSFPSSISISDPSLLPFLSPKVRAVVKAFPLQAEDVVRRNGLDSEEFNSMLQEVKTNQMFRWKVQKHLKQQQAKGGEKEVKEIIAATKK